MKPHRGRPKLPEDQRKSAVLRVRMRPQDLKDLQEAAEGYETTVGKLVNQILRKWWLE